MKLITYRYVILLKMHGCFLVNIHVGNTLLEHMTSGTHQVNLLHKLPQTAIGIYCLKSSSQKLLLGKRI